MGQGCTPAALDLGTVILTGSSGLRPSAPTWPHSQAQLLRVHNDVTQMFYSALSAQRTVELRGRLAALAGEAAQTAHRLANVGQADAPDVLQAEVEAEQAEIDYTLAQRMFIQKFKSLSALAGNPTAEIAPLDAAFDVPPEIEAVVAGLA